MYYTKGNCNKHFGLDTLTVYNRCPRCGAETAIPEFWDMLAKGQIEIYSTGVNCSKCTQDLIRSGKAVQM